MQVFIIVSHDPWYFCGVSCNFFFISNFIDLSLLPFILIVSLANGLSIFFIFTKKWYFASLIFAIVFFVSISFISALIFIISFLLLTLGFVCSSFSSCFRCKIRLIETFLVF